MKDSFVVYTRHMKHIQKLTDEQAGQLFKALYAFSVGEQPPELDTATDILYSIITEQMQFDSDKWESTKEARRLAGLKSAEARANKVEQKPTKPNKTEQESANSTVSVSVPVSVSVSGNDIEEKPAPAPKKKKEEPIKFPSGEFMNVLLSAEEQSKLAERYGNKVTDEYVNKLSGYMKSKGVKYKDHYATILNWIRKDNVPEKTATATGGDLMARAERLLADKQAKRINR